MMQQNIYPSPSNENRQIENKIILLFLIEKMDIPISNNQIAHFAVEENYMNFYTVQKYLSEMVEAGYLDKYDDSQVTRYVITDGGLAALDAFIKQIPPAIKNNIIKYVNDNRKTVKQDYEITANHFYDYTNNEYIVKCGVYEDEMMLMEINLSVVTKEQAISICNNWKNNVDSLYGQILQIVSAKHTKQESENQ